MKELSSEVLKRITVLTSFIVSIFFRYNAGSRIPSALDQMTSNLSPQDPIPSKWIRKLPMCEERKEWNRDRGYVRR